MFTPTWGRFPCWLICFKWVGSTTNYIFLVHILAVAWGKKTAKTKDKGIASDVESDEDDPKASLRDMT